MKDFISGLNHALDMIPKKYVKEVILALPMSKSSPVMMTSESLKARPLSLRAVKLLEEKMDYPL